MASAAKYLISNSPLFLGRVVPSLKENAVKIQVKSLGLDRRILMYFSDIDYIFATDTQKLCKTGDLVLVKKLPEKLTKLITHEVMRVVYPFGDVIDPVTNKKVVSTFYREDLDHEIELFGGRLDSSFDYKKAPPRGSQEDIRDLTHRESFVKWRDTGEDNKYAV